MHQGWGHIAPSIDLKLAERYDLTAPTERELEIIHLLAKGYNNKAIEIALDICEVAVKFHVNHLLGKMGASERTQALLIALKRGLVSL